MGLSVPAWKQDHFCPLAFYRVLIIIMTECMTVMTKNIPKRVLYNRLTVCGIGRLGIMSPCSMASNQESSPLDLSCITCTSGRCRRSKGDLTCGLPLAILQHPPIVELSHPARQQLIVVVSHAWCWVIGSRPPGPSCLPLHLEAKSGVMVDLPRGPSLARLRRPQLVVSPCVESCPLTTCVEVGGGADCLIRRLEHTRMFAYSHNRTHATSLRPHHTGASVASKWVSECTNERALSFTRLYSESANSVT